MFKVNIKDTRRTPCSGVFIVNFEHISHLALVFLLLTLSSKITTWRVLKTPLLYSSQNQSYFLLIWNIAVFTEFKPRRASNPNAIYLFKVSNGKSTLCEIYSKLPIETPAWLQQSRSGVFIAEFEEISNIFLVVLFLILNKLLPAGEKIKSVQIENYLRF